jgi:hypothetical protein
MGGQARLTIRCTLELDFLFWTHHSKREREGGEEEEVRREAQSNCRLVHQRGLCIGGEKSRRRRPRVQHQRG